MWQLQGGTAIRNPAATKPACRRSRRVTLLTSRATPPPTDHQYSWNIPNSLLSGAPDSDRRFEMLVSVRTAKPPPAFYWAGNDLLINAVGLARCLPPCNHLWQISQLTRISSGGPPN